MYQCFVEGDFGLVRIVAMAVAQQNQFAAVVSGIAVLHDKWVGILDFKVMRQFLDVQKAVVPRNEAFFGWLYEDKLFLVLHHLVHSGLHKGIIFLMVAWPS